MRPALPHSGCVDADPTQHEPIRRSAATQPITTAAVILAGGASARMGTPKAALAWDDTTLLARTCALLATVVDGPVVVARAPGQALPPLPPETLLVDDPHEGLGPLQGLATGLAAAAAGGAQVAFVAATDLPFLAAAFVRAVLGGLGEQLDAAVPVAGGRAQPLAGAYRTALAPLAQRLVDGGHRRPAELLERCRVAWLDGAALPAPGSTIDVDDPEAYQRARAGPR